MGAKKGPDTRQGRGSIQLAALGFAWAVGSAAQPARADAVYAWGYNGRGYLGTGMPQRNIYAPTPVLGLSSGVSAVVASNVHSLAVRNGGVYAWGENDAGQLGNGGTISSTIPVAVPALTCGVSAVAAGEFHSVAIHDGAVYTWGTGAYGQLGTGVSSYTPRSPAIVSALPSGVTAVAAGLAHNVAIKSGAVYTWGSNGSGELGIGTYGPNPKNVPVPVGNLSDSVSAIAAGYGYSFAIKNAELYAWGYNGYGQLGTGNTTDSTVPVQIAGLAGVTAVAAGTGHTLALRDGDVYAWGDNDFGQLGVGNFTNSSTPLPVELHDITAIAASRDSSFALSSDGSLWVWGANLYGELGLGTDKWAFVQPQQLLPPAGYKFTSVSGGCFGIHTVATVAVIPEPLMITIWVLPAGTMLRR